jgi:hypothetical protein
METVAPLLLILCLVVAVVIFLCVRDKYAGYAAEVQLAPDSKRAAPEAGRIN